MALRFSILAVAALVFAVPALAVTGGTVDGNAHPAVGLLLADRGNGPEPDCSGTLVAPTVFLTAGHCTATLASNRVWVTFDSAYTSGSKLLTGTAHTDPLYGTDKNDTHDLAVVVLDAPVTGIQPYSLPTAGLLDKSKLASVVVVGYGAGEATTSKKNPSFTFDFVRRYTTADVDRISKTELWQSLREGGACYGDSGGPELIGTTVVSVTSHGDAACLKRNAGYRLDTPQARAFLSHFVALP